MCVCVSMVVLSIICRVLLWLMNLRSIMVCLMG